MELKLRNMVKVIIETADKAKMKEGYRGKTFDPFNFKEVKLHIPVDVIEELRNWVKED